MNQKPAVVPPEAPIAVGPPADSPLADTSTIDAAVRADVVTTDWPDCDQAYAEAQVRKAGLRVEAATPHPFDPETSPLDRRALEAIQTLTEREIEAQARVSRQDNVVHEATRRLAALPAPWSCAKQCLIVLGLLVAFVFASTGIAALLLPGVQAVFLRPTLTAAWGAGARDAQLYASFAAAFLTVGCLLGFQLLATVVAWGKLGRWKALFLVLDAVFSLAFTLLRGGNAFWPALAAGLFEAALLGAASLAFGVVDKRCAEDAIRAAPYGLAKATLAAERDELEVAYAHLAQARRARDDQMAVLAARDGLVRTLDARRALAQETARVAYMTGVASLASKAAENPAERKLDEILDQELAVEHAECRKAAATRRY